jgi:2-C-methyl-D-erythritol 4-phosphate cytidylyltransferase/2-C-methyl-D-erythritol 2,4-cyclodiphosphate synthase
MHVVAIIAAGGRGQRLGSATPKQFLEIGGKTILQRTLETIGSHRDIDEIVLVLPPERVDDAAAHRAGIGKPLTIVAGGERRQDSVANGFAAVDGRADVILIHDAARPFVTARLISQIIQAAAESGAAIAALPVRDTVKQGRRTEQDGATTWTIGGTVPRDGLFLAQTPQAFRRDVLRAAIEAGRGGGEATDEAALAERAGHPVRLVDGEATNIKITTLGDLTFAEGLLRLQGDDTMTAPRVGTGYDLHRLVEGRPLILGGVTIPFSLGLAGHSDADAICHAATDAILGGAGAGDIGRHFPDSDPQWRGASSLDLLARAAAIVGQAGFAIENVDIVVIAERPKLAPYIQTMAANVAGAIGIDPSAVSIKGKTNEGVGEIGRGEAIAVHAVAMVTRA